MFLHDLTNHGHPSLIGRGGGEGAPEEDAAARERPRPDSGEADER